MKSFTHILNNDSAMPLVSISRLASIAGCYGDTTGKLEMGTRCAELSRPLKLATMGLRKGDAVTVSVDGPSEAEMFDVLCTYFSAAM